MSTSAYGFKERTGPSTRSATPSAPEKLKHAWKVLPDVWELIKPRRAILLLGFALMAVNRVAGLILPGSTKYLVDDVIGKRQMHLLVPLVLVVLAATVVQGLTSFSLTQLLSKSSQRMITELRVKVQAHIGRLPVSFYDSNKTGVLVSRIMSDVEGVRNLIGTGLIEFAGGIMTSIFALVILLRISVTMTVVAFGVLLVFAFGLSRAFKTIRPIYRARPKINAEVTGQAHGVARRRPRGEGLSRGRARRKSVFGRRAAAARERDQNAHGDLADVAFGQRADGNCERDDHASGRATDSGRDDDAGNVSHLHDFSRDAYCARHADCGAWPADDGGSGRPRTHAGDSERKDRRRNMRDAAHVLDGSKGASHLKMSALRMMRANKCSTT